MIFNAYSDTEDGLFGISVKSGGHIFAKTGRRISRPRGREDWLLFYIAKGCEEFDLEKKYVAEEGSFVFFKPFEKQEHIHSDEKSGEFYYIHFNAPENFDLFGFESSHIYTSKPSSRLRELFEVVIHELQTKAPCYEKICAAKLFEIILELSRRTKNESNPNKRYSDKISFVIQMINRDYSSDLSLEDYAKISQMSKFHFLRVFKEIVGVSPIEYRNNIRLEHAKELLEDISLPIGEIGAMVGYSSASYFCDAFRKSVGVSPKQYRENLK